MCLELLKDRMHSSHTLESLSFYLEVQAWKALDSDDPGLSRVSVARGIAQTYVMDGAPHEINIEAALRLNIMSQVSTTTTTTFVSCLLGLILCFGCCVWLQVQSGRVTVDTFAAAEKEILRLIRTNDLPRLRDSDGTCSLLTHF